MRSERFGQAVDFATTRQGNELFIGAGLLFEALERSLLDISLELWLRPPLESEPEAGRNRGSTSGLPAEWLLGVTSSDGDAFSIFAGGGTGLPFASETSADGETETVFAPTAPAFRALIALRYAPLQ